MQENDNEIRVYVEKEKKKNERAKKVKYGFNTVLALVAYIGIGCIAISLLFTLIFKGDSKVSDAFSIVGQVIAYILSMILAYNWVRSHRQVGWIVCYVIFVVTIVVLFILTI